MTGELMALNVIGKVHSRTKVLDTDTMRTLATSLIQRHYDYASYGSDCTSYGSGVLKQI